MNFYSTPRLKINFDLTYFMLNNVFRQDISKFIEYYGRLSLSAQITMVELGNVESQICLCYVTIIMLAINKYS